MVLSQTGDQCVLIQVDTRGQLLKVDLAPKVKIEPSEFKFISTRLFTSKL